MKPKRWLGRFAPYAGVGANLSRGVETTAKVNLANEIVTTPRGILGTGLSLGLVNLVAELDIAAVPTFSMRTGFKL